MSDPFDSLHPSYSDYDSYRGPPSTGICIPGPATAAGVFPNVNDVLSPGVTAFDYLFPDCRSATPKFQYPAEGVLRAVTPPPRSNSLGFQDAGSPGPFLSPLNALAHVASITRPASAPPPPPFPYSHAPPLSVPPSPFHFAPIVRPPASVLYHRT